MAINSDPEGTLEKEVDAHDAAHTPENVTNVQGYNRKSPMPMRAPMPMRDRGYLMMPRERKSDTVDFVAGGGQAGLRKTGRKSPEGIPYADLGSMNVSASEQEKRKK